MIDSTDNSTQMHWEELYWGCIKNTYYRNAIQVIKAQQWIILFYT